MKKIIIIFYLLLPELVFAKTTSKLKPIISNGDIAKLFISLASVIALVLIFSYCFKKMNNFSFGGSQVMNIISSIAIGQKEKIILLEVAGKNLLIGVSSGSISLLKELDSSELKKGVGDKEPPFVDSFKKFLNKGT